MSEGRLLYEWTDLKEREIGIADESSRHNEILERGRSKGGDHLQGRECRTPDERRGLRKNREGVCGHTPNDGSRLSEEGKGKLPKNGGFRKRCEGILSENSRLGENGEATLCPPQSGILRQDAFT